jgi:hypothetical protein
VAGPAAANAAVKLPALVAGMGSGADSIDDMDLLRHGGMGRLFGAVRAPSTLGSFLRTFTFGHVRQLDKVAAEVLTNLASHSPLLSDADQPTGVGGPRRHAVRRLDRRRPADRPRTARRCRRLRRGRR